MNRATALSRLSRTLLKQHQQVRHGGGGPVVVGPRWSNIVRGESNLITPDDPPTAPLSDDHEVGDGTSDFSKWYDNHDDLSTVEIVTGMGAGFLFFYGMYRLSQSNMIKKKPNFTIRECPTLEQDIPTMDHSIRRGPFLQEGMNKPA